MNDVSRRPASEGSLARDLHAVVDDTRQLVRHAAHDATERYTQARTRVGDALHAGREQAAAVQRAVVDSAGQAKRATDAYVHRHPWKSMGLAAGIALLAGVLLAHRGQLLSAADRLLPGRARK